MSKKRKREVDVELVKIYEELAETQESVRLKAAHTLLSKIFKPGTTSDEQIETILTRLFRGLCSSRKNARLGFSVALTELLSRITFGSDGSQDNHLNIPKVINILESQTRPEGGTSGQNERDHYFGRVFGVDAILKSGILFKPPYPDQWKRLLDLLCGVSKKKPWLRQECGWILFTCLLAGERGAVPEAFAVDTIEKFVEYKMIRTPEGVAIWLASERAFPAVKLPKSVWRSGNPLASRDINVLADILKDSRSQSEQENEDTELQGSARWSASLHFAWDIVLSEVFRDAPSVQHEPHKLVSGHGPNQRVPFDLFWKHAVDESLFTTSSSTERKAWGFSVWRKVFETGPQQLLQHTFTPLATKCLTNSLMSSERYLKKCALKVAQIFHTRLAPCDMDAPAQGITGACLRSLLASVSYSDFDQVTRSKVLQSLIDVEDSKIRRAISLTLTAVQQSDHPAEKEKDVVNRQKTILTLQSKVLVASLRSIERKQTLDVSTALNYASVVKEILDRWIEDVCTEDRVPTAGLHTITLLPAARDFAKDRLGLAFEQALKLGPSGCRLLRDAVLHVHVLENQKRSMTTAFESDVEGIVNKAWQRLRKLRTSFEVTKRLTGQRAPANGSTAEFPTFEDGMSLLYCLVLFQIYIGEHDAVQILQDLLNYPEHGDRKSGRGRKDDHSDDTEAMVEILLSFVSRPSKFLRRITMQIFEAFAPHLTVNSLQALCRILATKENAQGQQEMFQADDVEMMDGVDAAIASDVEELDSDVEVESLSSANDSSSEEEDSSNSSDDSDEDSKGSDASTDDDGEDEEDEELAAFDAALASALGTRRLDQDDVAADSATSDSSSDADMGDDEMLELDSKLAEVFRARNEQQSKNKKKEAREARETVVNFKNRVLDLLESYLKHQQYNPLTLEIILPLLGLARTSQTKQLAERACNMLQGFSSRSRGTNVVQLTAKEQRDRAFEVLNSIHVEVALESSHSHSTASSQMSILIAKSLTQMGADNIPGLVQAYAATRVRQLMEKDCHVPPGFFTDWNNWCQTAREKLAS